MPDPYIDAFFAEAVDTFRSMLQVQLNEDPAAPKIPEDALEVSAFVGLSGAANGSLMLIVTEDVACRLYARFTKQARTELDEMVMDGLVELVNIIGGNALGRLEKAGVERIVMSCPDIALGRPRENARDAGKIVQRVYQSELGPVTVEVKVLALSLVNKEGPR